jgi:hypothetical protein
MVNIVKLSLNFTKMTLRSEGKSIDSIDSLKGHTLNTINNIGVHSRFIAFL